MNVPLDRLAALCPDDYRSRLFLLSNRQVTRLREQIRSAIRTASHRKRGEHDPRQIATGGLTKGNRNPIKAGAPVRSHSKRNQYLRRWKIAHYRKNRKRILEAARIRREQRKIPPQPPERP